jgi:ABC-2 type transport system ATP-binding protein
MVPCMFDRRVGETFDPARWRIRTSWTPSGSDGATCPPTARALASGVVTSSTATTHEATVSVRGVAKSFGDVRALDGVDLEAAAGTVLGLLGPNGAGKTTAVRVMTTLLKPDAGEIRVAGLDAQRDAVKLRERIGLAGQYAAIDENLTGAENLTMVGRLYGMSRAVAKQRAGELLDRFDLADAGGRPARGYSGGMRRRLDLAAALVARPPVLFLDEPTTGLDPRSRLALWETIEGLVADGTTVLLTTQYLDEADRLADRIAVIDKGRVIADGTPDDLKDRVGGERLEIQLADAAQAPAVADALASMAAETPFSEDGLVKLAVRQRSGAIVEAVRRLDEAGVGVDDLGLRRPTLDDVFLTLTGHAAEQHTDGERVEETR